METGISLGRVGLFGLSVTLSFFCWSISSQVFHSTRSCYEFTEGDHFQWLACLQKKNPRTVGFWNFRCSLTLEDGLILKANRVVILKSMRGQVLQAIHLGHHRETKSILLARESVFWPGISNDIRQVVTDCNSCNCHQPAQPKLPSCNQTMGEAWDRHLWI